mmetsp:Transcript_75937/g.158384  ORF Transcript_75937/g.158384 Transcript_75937/m.158384 type:complete len:317 (+) Transcript_75937:186-1136(+)
MGDMNAPLRVKVRDGCRGGKDQFQWNSIKEQDFKDREQYLGQSTKVGMMGKFGRYQVHDWYNRKRDTVESIQSERASVQAYEEELMMEAMGLKPKKLLLAKKQLTEEEIKEHLKRDDQKSADKSGRSQMGPQAKIVTNEFGEQVATTNEEYVAVAAREAPVKGLGFAMHRTAKLEALKAETFGTEGQLQGAGDTASSSVKVEVKEEVVKEEPSDIKQEHADESAAVGVVDLGVSVKEEESGRSKRKRVKEEEVQEGVEVKKEKKDKKDKKAKKAEKKIKKLEKKLKKAAKKEKKTAKLKSRVADPTKRSSSSSSSS